MKLRELADALGGRDVDGDAGIELRGVASLEDGTPGDLGFVRSEAFAAALARSQIGAVIAPPGLAVDDRPVLRSAQPNLDFARAARHLVPAFVPPPGVHASAVVDPSARVDPGASVGPGCVVGADARIASGAQLEANVTVGRGVEIGEQSRLCAGVVVADGCRIGARVILQPSVVIGGDGFGYEFNERFELEKVPQVGNVVIEDDVEIGAGSTVDRARLGTTRIGQGAKIDNLVQIGHNVVVGPHSVIVAQTGIAGSTRLGSRVVFMAQSGAAGHLEIGDGAFVGARGGVIEDLSAGERVFGFPAVAERGWHRLNASLARLPELMRRVRRLEKRAEADDGSSSGE